MTKPNAAPPPPSNALWFSPVQPTEEELAARCKRSRMVREAMYLAKENVRLAKQGK